MRKRAGRGDRTPRPGPDEPCNGAPRRLSRPQPFPGCCTEIAQSCPSRGKAGTSWKLKVAWTAVTEAEVGPTRQTGDRFWRGTRWEFLIS